MKKRGAGGVQWYHKVGLVPTAQFCMTVMAPLLFPTDRYSNQTHFPKGHGNYFLDNFFSLEILKNLPHKSPKFDSFNLQLPKTEGENVQFKGEG